MINRALQTKPTDGSTNLSARSLAAATGISKTTVQPRLQTFSMQLHWQKLSRSRPIRSLWRRFSTSSACS